MLMLNRAMKHVGLRERRLLIKVPTKFLFKKGPPLGLEFLYVKPKLKRLPVPPGHSQG